MIASVPINEYPIGIGPIRCKLVAIRVSRVFFWGL